MDEDLLLPRPRPLAEYNVVVVVLKEPQLSGLSLGPLCNFPYLSLYETRYPKELLGRPGAPRKTEIDEWKMNS